MKKHTFLGISSTGDLPNIDILIDNQKLIRKLRDNGMCDAFGYPTSIKRLLCKPIEDITTYGNQVLRGLVNNNQGCRNYYVMHRIQYIIQYSIAYTITRKCDISINKVFKKYHKQLNNSEIKLKDEVHFLSISMTKCFYMRHKLYHAATEIINHQIISGKIKVDTQYLSLTLKGTCPIICQDTLKRDGQSAFRGISHHKISVICAVDDDDHMIMNVSGLGSKSFE